MTHLQGKRIAILLEDLYEDQEFWYPYYRLQEADAEVIVVGTKKHNYESKHGYPATADITIDQADPAFFDGLVIPGGYAPDKLRRYPEVIRFVRQMNDHGKPIAAICHAGWVLASADIIEDREVTGYISIKDDLVHAGAHFVDRSVVRDGNIITSRQPEDLPDFTAVLVEALLESSTAGIHVH
jgi:protease I